MDFSITDEQMRLIADLDRFCDENLSDAEIQQWIDGGGVPDWFIRRYYQNDFAYVGLPEGLGGTPAPYVTRVLLLEHLAMRAGATLPIQGIMLDVHILSHIANEEQMRILHESLQDSGRQGFSLAVTEAQSGSNTFDMHTTAVEEDDCFVINGAKSFVSSGQYAPYIILAAHDMALDEETRGRHKPLSFFMVDRDAEGLDSIPVDKIGQRLIPAAELIFDDVRIPKSNLMGPRGQAAGILRHSFEYGRVFVCATTVGMAQAALSQALEYAMSRQVSNETIISYQQIQEMLADMQINVNAMRSMLYRAARLLDEQAPTRALETSLLKRYVPKAAMEVADSAMQIMGSMGYVSSTKAARIWQECRGNRISEGTDQIMTLIAAKEMVKRAKAEKENPPLWRC